MNTHRDTSSGLDLVDLIQATARLDVHRAIAWIRELTEADTTALLRADPETGLHEIAADPPGLWSVSLARAALNQPVDRTVEEQDATARHQGMQHVIAYALDENHLVYLGWRHTLPEAIAARLRVITAWLHHLLGFDASTRALAASGHREMWFRERCPDARMVTLPDGQAIVWRSETMTRILRTLADLAPTDAAVLFLGETGVGKTVLARWLHLHSPRRERPFVHVIVPAIPGDLLPTSLFGVTRGAYTDAVTDRPGYIAMADGGTLFLDEIAEIAPAHQAVLLHVIEHDEYHVIGEARARRVDVRWLAATNRDTNLRSDLFYRIGEEVVRIPPVRERRPDIVPIFLYHAELDLAPDAAAYLEDLAWPGNHREIAHVARAARRRAQREGCTTIDGDLVRELVEQRSWND